MHVRPNSRFTPKAASEARPQGADVSLCLRYRQIAGEELNAIRFAACMHIGAGCSDRRVWRMAAERLRPGRGSRGRALFARTVGWLAPARAWRGA
jgi:hypothetical protein